MFACREAIVYEEVHYYFFGLGLELVPARLGNGRKGHILSPPPARLPIPQNTVIGRRPRRSKMPNQPLRPNVLTVVARRQRQPIIPPERGNSPTQRFNSLDSVQYSFMLLPIPRFLHLFEHGDEAFRVLT